MLAGHDTVSPVFVEDRLVLLWLGDPMRTPEGITVGTPGRRGLGHATRRSAGCDAPQGTTGSTGCSPASGDRAYLFLHDGRTVRKTIAGYADWARRADVVGIAAEKETLEAEQPRL